MMERRKLQNPLPELMPFLMLILLALGHLDCAWAWATRYAQQQDQQQQQPNNRVARAALSEFLIPPPPPQQSNPGPSFQRTPRNPNFHPQQLQQPGPPRIQSFPTLPPGGPVPPAVFRTATFRTGRYINGYSGNGNVNRFQGNSHQGPSGKLGHNWLGPGNKESPVIPHSLPNQQQQQQQHRYPLAQPQVRPYVPQQQSQMYHPGNSPTIHQSSSSTNVKSNLAEWMAGKTCNPCNQVPWVPIIGPSVQHQSAPNNQNQHPHQDAGPYSPLELAQPPQQEPPLEFHHQPYPEIDQQPHSSMPYDILPPYHEAQPFKADSLVQLPQPQPVIIDNVGALPLVDDHSGSEEHQPQAFGHATSPPIEMFPSTLTFEHHSVSYPPPTVQPHFQPTPISDPEEFNPQQHSEEESDHHPVYSSGAQDSGADFEEPHPVYHPDQDYEQPHRDNQDAESMPVSVNNRDEDRDHHQISSSTTVPTTPTPFLSSTTTTASTPTRSILLPSHDNEILSNGHAKPSMTFQFEESPLVDYHPVHNRRPPATLLDYIVSGPDKSVEDWRGPGSTIASPTTAKSESDGALLLETIAAQQFESHRKKNASSDGTRDADKEFFNASANELKQQRHGKKHKPVIQIIIPYTSQHTPSPFHRHSARFPDRNGHGHQRHQDDDDPVVGSEDRHESSIAEDAVDNNVIEESRRVTVTKRPDNATGSESDSEEDKGLTSNNVIDVHRLQKNIDNWTIQEYSNPEKSMPISGINSSAYPRWISSKQIPDEYLSPTPEGEESGEYYDFDRNETDFRHPHHPSAGDSNETRSNTIVVEEATTKKANLTIIEPVTAPTTLRNSSMSTNATVKVVYAKNMMDDHTKRKNLTSNFKTLTESERVYVVTPIPTKSPNSIEGASDETYEGAGFGSKESFTRMHKSQEDSSSAASSAGADDGPALERAYQVLPQAINNLAVSAAAPESAAPALWGLMEHEDFASAGSFQPRWRSEGDGLPEPLSTPVLYAGHSKVSRAR